MSIDMGEFDKDDIENIRESLERLNGKDDIKLEDLDDDVIDEIKQIHRELNDKAEIQTEPSTIFSAMIPSQERIVLGLQRTLAELDSDLDEVVLNYSEALNLNVQTLNMLYGMEAWSEVEFFEE